MDNYDQYIYSTETHYISNSGHDSRGQYSGDTAGDQTGEEWYLRSWYNRPWNCVLRYPDQDVAYMIAELGCAAALNDNIGYDQNQRDTYWTELQKVGYDPSNITTPCEEDCSSGVIANVKAVGYLKGITALQNITSTYTGNMRSGFKSAGFEVLTDSKYLSGYTYLMPGDILLNDSAHTATNVTKGANVTFSGTDSGTSSGTDGGTTSSTGDKGMTTTAEPETIWNFLYSKLGNAYGAAGLMGNLYAESALIPINLQDSYESKLGYTDKSYTTAVDNGTYTKFSSDSAGYGLAQWTYSTRKKALLSYVQSEGASVGNLDAQLGYLWKELQSDFPSLVTTLKSATSVRSASDAVLTKFEQPADQGSSVQSKRASYGQTYYDQYASGSSATDTGSTGDTGDTGSTGDTGDTGGTGSTGGTDTNIDYADYFDKNLAGKYTVTASSLNLRAGAGESKTILTSIPKGDTVQCYGYYSTVSGTNWLLVEYVKDSTTYTGFSSSKYLDGGDSADGTSQTAPLYYVKVSVSNLNIRAGAGTNYATKGYTGIGVFGITQEKTGQVNSGTGTWGKLLSGAGYIWLGAQHVTKL